MTEEELEMKADDFTESCTDADMKDMLRDAYLAGAKETAIRWHDFAANPEDLPPHEEDERVKDLSVNVTVVARSARATAFYDFKNRIRLDCYFGRLISGVTAWCERPEFVEEE